MRPAATQGEALGTTFLSRGQRRASPLNIFEWSSERPRLIRIFTGSQASFNKQFTFVAANTAGNRTLRATLRVVWAAGWRGLRVQWNVGQFLTSGTSGLSVVPLKHPLDFDLGERGQARSEWTLGCSQDFSFPLRSPLK